MKKYLTPLINREIQIKIKMRKYLRPIRIATVRKQKQLSVGEDVELLEASCAIGIVKRFSHSGNSMGVPAKMKGRIT